MQLFFGDKDTILPCICSAKAFANYASNLTNMGFAKAINCAKSAMQKLCKNEMESAKWIDRNYKILMQNNHIFDICNGKESNPF